MAQEDKGLVIRGLFLLTLVGGLVTFVVAVLFWRAEPPPALTDPPPESQIPLAMIPLSGAGYPSGVSWHALYHLGETLPSDSGWGIRYNAATALARRGSSSVPWALIREMLDEKQQMRNYRVRQPDGRDIYDEVAARSNMISALKALTAWHEKQSRQTPPVIGTELREIYALVDKLAESPFAEMKTQAETARNTFFR